MNLKGNWSRRLRSPGARRVLALAAVAVLAGAPASAAAQDLICDRGDLEVQRLRFQGNRAFSDRELAEVIVTTPSSLLRRITGFIGARRCLDESEVPRDEIRLALFYRKRGYYNVEVSSERIPRAMNRVEVRFRISEGPPVLIDSAVVSGLGGVGDSARIVRGIDLREGRIFDRYYLGDAVNLIVTRLRNNGYPRAVVLPEYFVDTDSLKAFIELQVLPGALARIDTVRLHVQPAEGRKQQISDRAVRRMLGLREGDLFSARELVNAQRALYQLDAFRHVEVRLAPDTATASDSLVAVDVALVEGHMRAARVGIGYATLDCFRTQAEFTDRNFLGGARRLDVALRLSKIGIAEPSDFAEALCRALSEDRFSQDFNYYAGATFRQPTFFALGPRSVPTITLYSERRSEYRVFVRSTPIGGLLSLTREPLPRIPATFSYQLEFGSTDAEPALFCAVFSVCVLGDQEELKEQKRLAVAGVTMVRDRSDGQMNPSSGSVVRLELRHASPTIGSSSDLRFNKWLADAAIYRSAPGGVLAARLRIGGVLDTRSLLSGASEFIPPQERLYAGGPTTVRGFRQNELGPVVYVVDRFTEDPDGGYYRAAPEEVGRDWRAVPTGGNSLVVGNLEYRLNSPVFPELLQWTVFADAGALWNRGSERGIEWDQIRWTPGAGVRIFTAIGAIRVDVGYNPYRRVAAPAYFDRTTDPSGIAPLYCVSPGNTLEITPGSPPLQEEGPCPATFRPLQRDRLFDRLTFNFSIGQPF